jgi:hypothetical protein
MAADGSRWPAPLLPSLTPMQASTAPSSPDATPSSSPGVRPPANRILHVPAFELGDRLTSEQRDFLDEVGFIRFKGFANPKLVRELAADVEAVDERLIREGRTHINGVPLIIGQRADGSRYVQRMCFASLFGDRLHRFLQDERFKGILEVAGPDFRIGERERDGLVVNHYRREPGSAFSRQGWHTDSLRDVFYLEKPRRYLNVGFYLDDSPVSKGGVRIIPFSHNQNLWNLLTRKAYYLDTEQDPAEYAMEAEAGDLTIHDGRIWHRVAQATAVGEASQRRVMYLPLMNGPLKEKNEQSPTPAYFKLRKLARF